MDRSVIRIDSETSFTKKRHRREPCAISRAWPDRGGMGSRTKDVEVVMQHRRVTRPCSTSALHTCRLAHKCSRESVADLSYLSALSTPVTQQLPSPARQRKPCEGYGFLCLPAGEYLHPNTHTPCGTLTLAHTDAVPTGFRSRAGSHK